MGGGIDGECRHALTVTGPVAIFTNGNLIRVIVQTDTEKFPSQLKDALAAVVSLRSTIPEDAFTAGILGTEREGYGAIIRSSGLVLTIGYLTAEAETIWITAANGQTYPGHVLTYDFETGFGLVQILERVDMPAIALGESANAEVGDRVIVAGAGRQSEIVVSHIVARQEFAGYWEYALDDALFTAPAHPNWGGAAVINMNGELIGTGSLLVQGAGEDNEVEDINMVVPIDILKPRLNSLLQTGQSGHPPRPWLGLYAADVSDQTTVLDVAEGGPAAESDIRQGDILLAVAGNQISGLGDFYRRVWALGSAGVEVPLQILRDGEVNMITVTSGDRSTYLKSPKLQ